MKPRVRTSEVSGVRTTERLHMAENWTHDRPLPAPPKGRTRRVEPQRARLELPMPMPIAPDEGRAQPAEAPERGFAIIDFYV